MTNNRMLSILCIVSMTATCLNLLGKEALAKDFSRTCRLEKLVDGRFLDAVCRDSRGVFQKTSLAIDFKIGNRNGRLVRQPKELRIRSGYLSSCKNVGLSGNSLQADCRTAKGDFRAASIDLNTILRNNGGSLEFDRILAVDPRTGRLGFDL